MRKAPPSRISLIALLLVGIFLVSCKSRKEEVAKYKYLLEDSNYAVTDTDKQPAENGNEATPPGPMRGEIETGMPVSEEIERVISKANTYLGTPYRYGGINENGLDCSGLTTLAYRTIGVELPRSSKDQSGYGEPIPRKELRPGDLIFFSAKNNGKVDHVGMVTKVKGEEVTFIHASTRKGVRHDRLDIGYWTSLFISARRPGVH